MVLEPVRFVLIAAKTREPSLFRLMWSSAQLPPITGQVAPPSDLRRAPGRIRIGVVVEREVHVLVALVAPHHADPAAEP